jgi:hypothetical protein
VRWPHAPQTKRNGKPTNKQESAPANVRALDGLLNMMAKRKGGKGVVVSAMGALVELFATALLPDRRLRVLEQQPLQVRMCVCGRGCGGCLRCLLVLTCCALTSHTP